VVPREPRTGSQDEQKGPHLKVRLGMLGVQSDQVAYKLNILIGRKAILHIVILAHDFCAHFSLGPWERGKNFRSPRPRADKFELGEFI
jgi:hypothetical protein